jgi:hypothetical protein
MSFDFTVGITDVVMVFVVLFSPFLAVFAQRKIDLSHERRERKLAIFRTLMATRGAVINGYRLPEHVEALNMIDLSFTNKGDEIVRRAWKAYLNVLSSISPDKPIDNPALAQWNRDRVKSLCHLLARMGENLGFRFDEVDIEKAIYHPPALTAQESEQQIIRRLGIQLLNGEIYLKTAIVPPSSEAAVVGEELMSNLIRVLKAEQRLRVGIEDADTPPVPMYRPPYPPPTE